MVVANRVAVGSKIPDAEFPGGSAVAAELATARDGER